MPLLLIGSIAVVLVQEVGFVCAVKSSHGDAQPDIERIVQAGSPAQGRSVRVCPSACRPGESSPSPGGMVPRRPAQPVEP